MNCYICGDETTIVHPNSLYPSLTSAAIIETLHKFLSSPVIRFLDKRDYDDYDEEPKCCNDCLSKITEYDKTLRTLNQIEFELQKLFYNKIKNDKQIQKQSTICIEPSEPSERIDNITTEIGDIQKLVKTVETTQKSNENHIIWYSSLEEIENDDKTNVINPNEMIVTENRIHVLRVHDTEDRNKINIIKTVYQCSECDETFTIKKKLKIHLNAHIREKKGQIKGPFKCELCNKIFKIKFYYDRHLAVHTGERNTQCEFCGKTFNATNYEKHKLIHLDRTIKCSICEKGFIGKNDLARHMTVHTREKRFKCPDCDKCFSFSGSRMSHQKRHHGPPGQSLDDFKKHKCQICNSRFESNFKLNLHSKVKHAVVGVEKKLE